MTSLRQRMLEDMQVRRLSACTQRTYVETVARFARYFDRSPARLGPEEIRGYQVYLTNERRLAPSSLVVAVSALRFLYRVTLQKRWVFDDMIPAPKKPRSLPVVLSPEEVVQFLDGVKAAKHHAILTTCYAAGLRISEAIHLTVSAIDSERMVLRIAKGKGQKDRYVMLSPKLLAILRTWWKVDSVTKDDLLTENDVYKVFNHLEQQGVSKCVACSHPLTALAGTKWYLRTSSRFGYPCVVVMCNNCGYVHLFRADVIFGEAVK